MNNEILDKIKKFAIQALQQRPGGYCGVAEMPNTVLINSDDGEGNDIKITIEIKPE